MTSPDASPRSSRMDETLRHEQEFFDQLIEERGEFNPFTDRGWKVLKSAFRKMAPGKFSGALLDVGCGTGSSLKVYEGRFASYTGLDLSPVSIARARQKHPEHEWQAGNALQLPFSDARFDAVVFSSVLHHLPAMEPALLEARRVLKEGGFVFAFDPNVFHPAMALLRHPRSPFYVAEGVSPDEKPLRPGQLREVFQAAGFRDIRQRCLSGIAYEKVAPARFNAGLAAFNVFDRIWAGLGIGRWLGTFVLTCAVK